MCNENEFKSLLFKQKTVKTVVPVPGETIDFIVFEMSTQNVDISVILLLKQLNSIFASKESKIFLYSEGFMSLTQNSQGTEEPINVNRLWISGLHSCPQCP